MDLFVQTVVQEEWCTHGVDGDLDDFRLRSINHLEWLNDLDRLDELVLGGWICNLDELLGLLEKFNSGQSFFEELYVADLVDGGKNDDEHHWAHWGHGWPVFGGIFLFIISHHNWMSLWTDYSLLNIEIWGEHFVRQLSTFFIVAGSG